MKKILAFGASSSRQSINKKFATYAASQIDNVEVNLLDLNDFEMPIYSVDRESEMGVPEPAQRFKKYIKEADGILISFAEHNSSFTTAFKNILDWTSRIKEGGGKVWEQKPMFLMSTSPGGRGGKTVLDLAVNTFSFRGGEIEAHFSLPFFGKNFSEEEGILDSELTTAFREQLNLFVQKL